MSMMNDMILNDINEQRGFEGYFIILDAEPSFPKTKNNNNNNYNFFINLRLET